MMLLETGRLNDKVYAVPCLHPAVKNGTLYCVPLFSEQARALDDYCFMMADTFKVMPELEVNNPKLLKIAEDKFMGEFPDRSLTQELALRKWLEPHSLERPLTMGLWSFDAIDDYRQRLRLVMGQAAHIMLVRVLMVSQFPIAVPKKWATLMDDKFGFTDRPPSRPGAASKRPAPRGKDNDT